MTAVAGPRPAAATAARRQRGFALLIVLWTMSLLALIGAQVTSAGRTEARLAANLRGSAIAEAAADAAVQEAAIRLLQPGAGRWQSGGTPYTVRLPQAVAVVTIDNEGRRLPLNTAPLPMLNSVLRQVGADARTAATLASQIADWRSPANFPLKLGAKAPQYRAAGRLYGPSNRPFRSLGELGLVLSMTPELLARLAPHVTPYTQSNPKPEIADPIILAAMREASADGAQALSFDESPTYDVTAVADAAGGGRFVRRAIIRLNGVSDSGTPTRAFDILAWREGLPGPLPD